jgi:hypothetical protein
VWRPRSCGLVIFCRIRQYIGRCLIGIGVAVALMALCVGWLVYDVAAQTNDATDNGTLTVGKCLANANTSVGPVEETFVKEGIIRESLISTKVTKGMCQDMLERAPDVTLLERLVTAQNYIQDLKLIQNAIPETAAKGTDRHLFGDEALVSLRLGEEADEIAAQAQYPDDETPAGGGGDRTGVEPNMQQAATASSTARAIVAEGDASIADMLDQIEAALIEEGIPRSEAVSKARCSLEEELLNAISKEISRGDSIRVRPEPTPKELEQGDTIPVKLVMSGAIREVYGKLEGQYEQVAEASEAKDGCVQLDGTVKAALYDDRFAVSSRQGSLIRPITHDATWRWDLTANREGKNSVGVLLGPVLQHAEQDLQPKWIQPAVLDAQITVKTKPLAKASNPVEQNWRWLLPVGIVLMVATAWLVGMLRKREQRHPSDPGGHG